jgi:2-haloacid dehalogenase
MTIPHPRALAFDVFGTVVDWRGSIIREGEAFGRERGLQVDWAGLADAWRAGYQPAMARVRSGELPWTRIDDLHRMILESLLPRFGLSALSEADRVYLNRVWHRLDPWPDSVEGLSRLKRRHVIVTLSNGNVSLLTSMAKRAGLPWDCIFSAETFHHYKPDPETYLGAARLLDLTPAEVMMVAAHKDDLRSAARCGLRTAFVRRPLEFGPGSNPDLAPEEGLDVVADDFLDLAWQLGA